MRSTEASRLSRFTAYEIAPVAEFDDGHREARISMDEARAFSDCTYWSLFGRTPSGEYQCIGDYCDYFRIVEMYTAITGCIAPENPDAIRLTNLPIST